MIGIQGRMHLLVNWKPTFCHPLFAQHLNPRRLHLELLSTAECKDRIALTRKITYLKVWCLGFLEGRSPPNQDWYEQQMSKEQQKYYCILKTNAPMTFCPNNLPEDLLNLVFLKSKSYPPRLIRKLVKRHSRDTQRKHFQPRTVT